MTSALYRAIEGTIENRFCDDDGNITASEYDQRIYLLAMSFSDQEINEYFEILKADDAI